MSPARGAVETPLELQRADVAILTEGKSLGAPECCRETLGGGMPSGFLLLRMHLGSSRSESIRCGQVLRDGSGNPLSRVQLVIAEGWRRIDLEAVNFTGRRDLQVDSCELQPEGGRQGQTSLFEFVRELDRFELLLLALEMGVPIVYGRRLDPGAEAAISDRVHANVLALDVLLELHRTGEDGVEGKCVEI